MSVSMKSRNGSQVGWRTAVKRCRNKPMQNLLLAAAIPVADHFHPSTSSPLRCRIQWMSRTLVACATRKGAARVVAQLQGERPTPQRLTCVVAHAR